MKSRAQGNAAASERLAPSARSLEGSGQALSGGREQVKASRGDPELQVQLLIRVAQDRGDSVGDNGCRGRRLYACSRSRAAISTLPMRWKPSI